MENAGVRGERCSVSVIVPVYNEIDFIADSLRSIAEAASGQDAEVLVIDGGSTDGSLAVIEGIQREYPFIRLLSNPMVKQVFGLNLGIKAARGKYIVRCDAHSLYPKTYFKNFVRFYEDEAASARYGNVGVPYETRNTATGIRRGIAEAMQSRFGVGGGHRVIEDLAEPKPVDTVLFGAWPAEVFTEVGSFDERFVRGQDYEHNLRIRGSGRLVAQIPGEKFEYYTRASFGKLARMIGQYAHVKGQLLALTWRPPNLRSMAPVMALLGAVALLPFPRVFLGAVGAYGIVVLLVALRCAFAKRDLAASVGVVLAIPLMHASHAIGFMRGFFRTLLGEGANSMESTR